jgi:hypothetical protein
LIGDIKSHPCFIWLTRLWGSSGLAEIEADHFDNCPVCGAFLDMRDLDQVLAHVHDAEIEIGE